MIIGLGGYAGVGKDTIADIMVSEFGFVKMAFADPLREMALAIDPIIDWGSGNGPVRYSEILDSIGYRNGKDQFPEIRRFLQKLGTEAVREVIGQDTWVDLAMRRAAQHEKVVFADMRFPNEASAICANAGLALRVHRPGVKAANSHPSEVSLDEWDFEFVFENSGGIEDVPVAVATMLDNLAPLEGAVTPGG